MRREQTLEEISDGRLYDSNDMVKADCHDCEGCCDCCQGMGDSVILDPFDVHRLSTGLKKPVEQLLQECLEFGVSDGNILPHLRMTGAKEQCVFLNREGRCSIHAFRPGICRLFPLGRFYEDGSFKYFLQVHECPKTNKTKVKIKKWLDTPDLKKYETYIARWHGLLIQLQEFIAAHPESAKAVSMDVLQRFYLTPYQTEEFYSEFFQRMDEAKKAYC